MFKKIVLLALLMVPTFAFAQGSLKVGYFNRAEVIQDMPEYAQLVDSIQKQAQVFGAEMEILRADFEKKYTDYMEQQETLVESIKVRRMQEIQE